MNMRRETPFLTKNEFFARVIENISVELSKRHGESVAFAPLSSVQTILDFMEGEVIYGRGKDKYVKILNQIDDGADVLLNAILDNRLFFFGYRYFKESYELITQNYVSLSTLEKVGNNVVSLMVKKNIDVYTPFTINSDADVWLKRNKDILAYISEYHVPYAVADIYQPATLQDKIFADFIHFIEHEIQVCVARNCDYEVMRKMLNRYHDLLSFKYDLLVHCARTFDFLHAREQEYVYARYYVNASYDFSLRWEVFSLSLLKAYAEEEKFDKALISALQNDIKPRRKSNINKKTKKGGLINGRKK